MDEFNKFFAQPSGATAVARIPLPEASGPISLNQSTQLQENLMEIACDDQQGSAYAYPMFPLPGLEHYPRGRNPKRPARDDVNENPRFLPKQQCPPVPVETRAACVYQPFQEDEDFKSMVTAYACDNEDVYNISLPQQSPPMVTKGSLQSVSLPKPKEDNKAQQDLRSAGLKSTSEAPNYDYIDPLTYDPMNMDKFLDDFLMMKL